MLTNHKIKQIQSLDKKKFRQKYNLFAVEGNKIITELLSSPYQIREIYTQTPEVFLQTPEVPHQNSKLPNQTPKLSHQTSILPHQNSEIPHQTSKISQSVSDIVIPITEPHLRKISFLQNPKDSLALVSIREQPLSENANINLVLDNIQDPGNLGTIIRLADWFGIEQIICSKDTVDYHNPKVIQATMGSFARVNIVYLNLEEFFQQNTLPTFGTDMQGTSIYKKNFPPKMNIIMGNEGNGISTQTEQYIDEMLTIPRFGNHQTTESLNVSMATGIILGEIFSRR